MQKYIFSTTPATESYCDEIVSQLVMLFNISEKEAVGCVNKHWSHTKHMDDDCMLFHMLPDEWAREMYYGSDSYWWNKQKKDFNSLP